MELDVERVAEDLEGVEPELCLVVQEGLSLIPQQNLILLPVLL